jgi:hypothetical protein
MKSVFLALRAQSRAADSARIAFWLVATHLLLNNPAWPQSADDEGAHVLVMVVQLASRAETLATGEDGALGVLRANGISEDEIRDGSVAAGIKFCCGGKVSMDTRLMFYVPPSFGVSEADVVEVAIGRPARRRRGDPGAINRAIRIRESLNDTNAACHWDPEDDRLWTRILYCDWMSEEGWQLERGLDKTWFRPAADAQ